MKPHAFSVLTEFEKQLPYFLIGAGHNYEQEPIDRPFGYPYYQWIQFLRGEGTVHIGKTETRVVPGQALFLRPNEDHFYHAFGEEPWIVSWFTFGGSNVERMLHTLGLRESGVYTVTDPPVLELHIEKSLHVLKSKDPSKGIVGSGLVYTFILHLYRFVSLSNDGSLQKQHSKLEPVFEFIEENYQKPIAVDDLSALLNISSQHFCLLFKKAMKTRPFEYINNYRINKSKMLLCEHPDMRITEIAHNVGYDSESYFCSVFKRLEGISPGEFRRYERGHGSQ